MAIGGEWIPIMAMAIVPITAIGWPLARAYARRVEHGDTPDFSVRFSLHPLGDDLLASPGRNGMLLRCSGNSCAPFSHDPYAPSGPVQVATAAPDRIWLLETDADRAQHSSKYNVYATMLGLACGQIARRNTCARVAPAGVQNLVHFQERADV